MQMSSTSGPAYTVPMATAALIPVEQYLRTGYEPDAEFIDGKVQTRPAAEYDHSTWQQAIQQWFAQHTKEWNIRVRCELRVQVSPTRYRVPDVVVFDRNQPIEQILTHPPIAVFEVLSPEDTIARMLNKLDDYAAMGIQNIYLVDPRSQRTYKATGGELRNAKPLETLSDTAVLLNWSAISALRD